MADNSSFISGALGGAATGATIGSAVLPGIGTVIGALGGAILGGSAGGKKQKAVDSALAALNAIPKVDPLQAQFKDQLVREKQAVRSGFSTDFQVARDIIGQSEAGGFSVAAQLAQTNPSLALSALNQVSNNTDVSVNKALGTIATQNMGYTQLVADQIDRMSQRSLQLSLLKSQYQIAQATADKKDFNQNALAALMKFGPSALGSLKGMNISGMITGNKSSGGMYDSAGNYIGE